MRKIHPATVRYKGNGKDVVSPQDIVIQPATRIGQARRADRAHRENCHRQYPIDRRQQLDFKGGLLHVNRNKNGIPSVHPLRGPELLDHIPLRRTDASLALAFCASSRRQKTEARVVLAFLLLDGLSLRRAKPARDIDISRDPELWPDGGHARFSTIPLSPNRR